MVHSLHLVSDIETGRPVDSRTKTSLAGGVLAAIGASACCAGPLVLLSLGIGGAWIGNLTKLEPVRPLFIIATIIFLGFAFRRLYLTPAICAPGAACANLRVQKRQRILFWVTAAVVGLIVSSTWLLPLVF